MRGELVSVWSETWREIWLPLIDAEDVPNDVFSELYRELAQALKDPVDQDAFALPLNDAIQLREAFDASLFLAGAQISLAEAHQALDASGALEVEGATYRRAAAESALTSLIKDESRAAEAFGQALAQIAHDVDRRAEARERAIDRIINDPQLSKEQFERLQPSHFAGERAVVSFLEVAHDVLSDLGGDALSSRYFNLLSDFIQKFSLRYDLRVPCTLCPTLSGVFASLVGDLRAMARQDPHLNSLMKDFEDAVRDLRFGCTDSRIRTCISRQVMLLEGMGAQVPGVTKNTLGDMCDQLATWPHPAIKQALKNLYGFASDYPGIRHGASAKGVLRAIDMRDMVAMSILLAGFTPYIGDGLNPDALYQGI